MFKFPFIYIFLFAFVPEIYGQLVYDLPGDLGYDNNAAQNYIENRLSTSDIDELERLKLVCILSRVYNAKGLYEKADSVLAKVVDSPSYSFDHRLSFYLAKANVKKFVKEIESADSLYEKVYVLSDSLNKLEWKVLALVEWAEFCRKFSEYDAAKIKLTEAISILDSSPHLLELKAYALNRFAAIYNERGTPEESLDYSNRAIIEAKKVNNNFLLAVSYNELGYAYRRLAVNDSVIYYYQKAHDSFVAAGMDVEAARARFNEFEYKKNSNQVYPDLENEILNFIDTIENNDIGFLLRGIYLLLTEYYEESGKYKEAYEYLWKFHNIDHEYFKLNVDKELVSVRKKFKNAQVEIENKEIKEDLENRKREIESKNNLIKLVVVGFGLIVIISFIIYKSYHKSKKLARELKEQNHEKDFLIQEVHHRVKNNLNFIQSLLAMQERATGDINEAKAIHEASVRINSVSMVHEMLYNDDANGMVDLQKYIVDLIKNLNQTYEGTSIQTKVDVDPISLNIQKSTAIGLLITECFNNSVKHAFDDIEEPEFSVSLIHIDINKNIKFSISDNGTKSMDLSEVKKTNSLGMRLIDIFSRQLQGEYSIEIADGFKYQLWMKNEEENSNR